MIIRSATLEDCPAIHTLICEIENCQLPYPRFAQIFQHQLESDFYESLVCEDGGKLLGVLNLRIEDQLHHTAPMAEILEFAVSPQCRSLGIGRKMLAAACETARTRGCQQIEVACNQLRTDAHRFYLREGMQNFHYRFSKNLLDDTPTENALGR